MCDKGYRLTLSDPFIKCTHNKLSTLMEWLPYLDESACQKPSVGNVVQELDLLYPCPCKPTSDYYDSRRRSFTSALRTHSGCRRRKERLGFCNQSKNKLFLECIDDVKLKVRVTVDLDEIKTIASTKEARLIVEKGAKEIVEMVVTKKITAKGSDSKEYPADNSTALSQALVICEEGWLMDDQGCSKCPKGTFMSNGKCEFCPVDSYQDQSGKTFCHKCPPNKQTATYGSMNVYYCKLRPVTGEGSMNKIIIGGVIGGFVFLLAILLIIGFIHRRRKNNQMKKEQERKRRQRLARERRKKKKKADKADSEEASGARSETETNTEQANGQIPNNESATAVAAIQTQATKKRKPPPSETSTQNNEADDATSVAPSDIVTQTDATSTKSIDDDTKSAGAESAIFTDGGASDTMSVVSSEMPLKSALKKRSKPPPSYLEDDQTTIISASTISVGRVRQMQKRPVSLDEDRNTKYSSDSMRRGRGAGRSMSMRRPESVSPNRFRPEGPQSLPVQGMPMKRSMSMERGPNPGYDPRLLPHHNPAPMMVRPPGGPGTMPPGGPNMMGQPPRRRGPMYPTYAPRGMHPPGNLPYQAGKMRNPYMTLQPGARPPRGAYWNPAFDGSPNDWEGMAMRNDAKMRPPPQMMTMPRNMGARYRMPNGMMPNGGHGNIPPHLRHRMPSPPPYYA
uniref:Uncharacterized protein LOC100176236 n=1 Tax=Phallusia mammillata TaxID=59560 RepID=A0A6F9DGM1_9ASCI|nr:uncharacterized protein LOC100176236 [Phallusia mammillata]